MLNTPTKRIAIQMSLVIILLTSLVACPGGRIVVDTEGNTVDTPRIRAGLALNDFSAAFTIYGDAVVNLREEGVIAADRADGIIRTNIAVSEAVTSLNASIRGLESSDSVSLALDGFNVALDLAGELVPMEVREAYLLAVAYASLVRDIAALMED